MSNWHDFSTVLVDIASITVNPAGAHSGYWQPDGHQSTWQPPGAVPGNAGYGEWSGGIGLNGYDWDSFSWYTVQCDTMQVEASTGWQPFSLNGEPGALSVTLYDQDMIYTPLGPTGSLDDIGIDTPIRVRVAFDRPFLPVNNKPVTTVLWAGYIRRIVHNHSIDGSHITVINASEVVETYGRVNPVALTTLAPQGSLDTRLNQIHQRSDKPGAFPPPDAARRFLKQDPTIHPADDLHQNLWQELCMAGNVHNGIMGTLCYPPHRNYWPGGLSNTGGMPGTPRAMVADPNVDSTRDTPGDVFRIWVNSMQVRPYCTDPNRTTMLPSHDNPTAAEAIAIAPTHLALSHSLDGVANFIDLAIADAEGSAQQFSDAGSISRWGQHSYTRHDLKIRTDSVGTTFLTTVGNRSLARQAQAVHSLDALVFPVATPRDLVALVGQATYGHNVDSGRNAMCVPGDFWGIVWDEPAFSAYMMICSVAHNISPDSWTVNISGELYQVDGTGPSGLLDPIPAAVSLSELEFV